MAKHPQYFPQCRFQQSIPYSNSFDILHQISIRQEVHHQYILSSIRFERRHRKFNLQEEQYQPWNGYLAEPARSLPPAP